VLGARLTAIGRTADPDSLLSAVFGAHYAHKPYWPWEPRRYSHEWNEVSGERAPDLLVYWTPRAPQMHELPAGSILLGALVVADRTPKPPRRTLL